MKLDFGKNLHLEMWDWEFVKPGSEQLKEEFKTVNLMKVQSQKR